MALTSWLGRGFTGRVDTAQCRDPVADPGPLPLPDTPPAAGLSGNRRCSLRLLLLCPVSSLRSEESGACVVHPSQRVPV